MGANRSWLRMIGRNLLSNRIARFEHDEIGEFDCRSRHGEEKLFR
jgi:hypothetical protein